jgi:AcrR family transcriptional regulator
MAAMESDDLPASLRTAWGLGERPRKGPRPALSLERIVAAAVGLAARDGIGAVSMQRVAKELGASPMGLYRYVAAKEELLALMVDAALGPPPAAPDPADGWRAGLERWAWAYHDVLQRHPWALAVPVGPTSTPNLTGWMEHGLRALAGSGLTEPEKLSVLLLLSGYVRNDAGMRAGLADARERGIMPTWGAQLARLTDEERFPALRAALASDAFAQDDDPDDEFVFGLERVLDGVAVLVAGREDAAGGSRGPAPGRRRRPH